MHTTTHILAWLPCESMGLGDLTPALPLFYPNLIYLHVGWATTAAFLSLHYTYYTSLVISATDTVHLPLPVSIYIQGRDSRRRSKHKQYIQGHSVKTLDLFLNILLLTNKFVLVMFQAISELKIFFLSDIGSDRNWGSVWPMGFVSVPPFFCNIVYKLSNFVFYTELNARLPIVMIIKQLN